MKIFKSCAVPILLFAMFFGGYAYFFLPRVDPMWLAYVFAGVAALMLYIALGAITTLFRTRTIAAALRGARQMRLPEDGKLTLVQGAVVAVGETLHAPFSNKPCISYEYHVYRTVETSSSDDTGYRTAEEPFAFGLAKSAYLIHTSWGDVRPLGYPTLDYLPKVSWIFSDDAHVLSIQRPMLEMFGITEAEIPQFRQRTGTYLQGEHFKKASGLGLVSTFAQLVEAIEEDTDFVRRDWKVSDPENLDGVTVVETHLEQGQHVCALGKWDAKGPGMQPPIELIAGDYKDAQRVLIANKRSNAVFGLLVAILMSAMLVAFAWFSSPPLSKDARPYRDESFRTIVLSAPAHVILEMCQGGVDPNERDTFGTPPIFLVMEADKLQALLDCGADPNLRDADGETKLSEAARYGDVESLRALLEAGAEIEAEIPEFGRGWTAMVSAYTAGRSEAVDFLAEAGAYDERVTVATGEPLTGESAPMQTVRTYLAAIQAGDLQAMERLRTGMSPGWSEGIALEIWQKYYPSEPILKQGFGNDHAATVELESHMIEDLHVREFFHLEYVTEGDTPQWLVLWQWDEPLPE